ncbi:MAG: hypothetical protein ISR77_07725 [Pirellulaceae bacterium]|nr:hypothetical protein [Pirellulaceae bacterium]
MKTLVITLSMLFAAGVLAEQTVHAGGFPFPRENARIEVPPPLPPGAEVPPGRNVYVVSYSANGKRCFANQAFANRYSHMMRRLGCRVLTRVVNGQVCVYYRSLPVRTRRFDNRADADRFAAGLRRYGFSVSTQMFYVPIR